MEGKIIYEWDKFEKEFNELEDPTFYINLDVSEKGNVLRIYADSIDGETVLIFEPENMDLQHWMKELEKRDIEYKWGQSPVKIVEM